MPLFRVKYYQRQEHSSWQTDAKRMFVRGPDAEAARGYVKNEATRFKGFPDDHERHTTVTEIPVHDARE